MEKREQILSYITSSANIVLVGHLNPDGDAIGSMTGMKHFLESNGKSVDIVVPNRYPEFLAFLDPQRKIIAYDQQPEQAKRVVEEADLIFCMDLNSLKRIDQLGELIGGSELPKILVDHHPQPDHFDVMISDVEASSTCEVAFYLIDDLLALDSKLVPLPLEGCNALYTGMMTDTNNFANSVRSRTFEMACRLMERGVDKEALQIAVYNGYSEQRMRLMGYMLDENLQISYEDGAAVMVLTKEIKERFAFQDGDSEGFVNLALNIKGVEVSALFTESDGYLRVSLRSKGGVSVNRMSRLFFNGGGHERAAGGRLQTPADSVREYFFESLRKYRHMICNENQIQ